MTTPTPETLLAREARIAEWIDGICDHYEGDGNVKEIELCKHCGRGEVGHDIAALVRAQQTLRAEVEKLRGRRSASGYYASGWDDALRRPE